MVEIYIYLFFIYNCVFEREKEIHDQFSNLGKYSEHKIAHLPNTPERTIKHSGLYEWPMLTIFGPNGIYPSIFPLFSYVQNSSQMSRLYT